MKTPWSERLWSDRATLWVYRATWLVATFAVAYMLWEALR